MKLVRRRRERELPRWSRSQRRSKPPETVAKAVRLAVGGGGHEGRGRGRPGGGRAQCRSASRDDGAHKLLDESGEIRGGAEEDGEARRAGTACWLARRRRRCGAR